MRVIVGSGTARADNPLLTARPASLADMKRTATRVVVDSAATLSSIAVSCKRPPMCQCWSPLARRPTADSCERLTAAGVEVFPCAGKTHEQRIAALLDELGRRRMTNVLVEGGSKLLGALFDLRRH